MKKLLTECFFFCRSNFKYIFKIFGPFILITAIISPCIKLLSSWNEYNWLYVSYVCIYTCIHTYLMARFIKFMAMLASGEVIDLSVSPGEWFKLLSIYIFYSLAVMLGFVAFILPGLYFAARYGFADFEAILNGKSPVSALTTSWQDTKGVTQKLMVVTALSIGSQIAFGSILSYAGEGVLVLNVVAAVANELLSSCVLIFMSVVYFRVYTTSNIRPDSG